MKFSEIKEKFKHLGIESYSVKNKKIVVYKYPYKIYDWIFFESRNGSDEVVYANNWRIKEFFENLPLSKIDVWDKNIFIKNVPTRIVVELWVFEQGGYYYWRIKVIVGSTCTEIYDDQTAVKLAMSKEYEILIDYLTDISVGELKKVFN